MGRAGITLLDVTKAALQLQGRGKTPTVDGIREILGTGSKSTIATYLRTWKMQQTQGSGKLPQDLLALVTGLWEQLNSKAEERIGEAESNHAQELHELNSKLIDAQRELVYLKTELHQSEETRINEQAAKENLAKQLLNEQQEHEKLQSRYQSTSQQLSDYKTENTRLHQLAANVQANLEHYQNTMQQLRAEQAFGIEKQQIKSQQEISSLQKELLFLRDHAQKIEQQFNYKNLALQQLQEQYSILKETCDLSEQKNQKYDRELAIMKDRSDQYSKIIDVRDHELLEKNALMLEMGKQIAILTDKVNTLQKNLRAAEDKIENLRHEKLFLAQEKAELQGHLKQLSSVKSKQQINVT